MVPKMIAICGIKNSGKTTLITKIVKDLVKRGYKVAAVKHDGHDFCPDVPGTDSFRMREAGAYGTAVFSSERFLVYKEEGNMDERRLIGLFPESDVILLEGFKYSAYPKLEIIRDGVSCELSAGEEGMKAILTDIPRYTNDKYPVLDLNKTDEIVRFISSLLSLRRT